jgi:DHA1 family putative efflux transporter-like MFS transporter
VAATFGWKVIFVGIGILSLLAIFAVARTIPPTEGDAPIPLGKQLALLKNPEILNGFGVTFFWQLGYAMLYAYIAPFLLNVTSMSERQVSIALFAFGIAILIGSKFGGFLTDRIGIPKSLLGGMIVHVIALALLSSIAKSTFVTIPLLMLWAFSAWSSGPGLQFNLVALATEASGIMLSLYGSILQLSIAATSVAFAVILAAVLFSRKTSRRLRYESN